MTMFTFRRRAGAVASSLAVTVAMATLGPGAGAAEPVTVVSTDTSKAPTVNVVVALPSAFPSELPSSAFKVAQGRDPLPVAVQPLAPEQLEVALVIDTSWSMNGAPLAAAKAAARSLLSQLPESLAVSVVGFGARPAVVIPRSTDRPAQMAAVNTLSASGETALYDALATAVAQFPPASGTRRMVVALSDGGDTASTTTVTGVTQALVDARASLFAVELKTPDSNPATLAQLAASTGGRVVPASDPTALGSAFDAVARQLVRQYSLTFDVDPEGTAEVSVVVEHGGLAASGRQRLALSHRPSAGGAPTASAAAGDDASTGPAPGRWALVAGSALTGAALLAMFLAVFAFRPPRARGLDLRRRGLALAGAAAKAEQLSESALRPRAASAVASRLDAAGVDVRPGEFVIVVAAGALAALALGSFVATPVAGMMLAALVVLGSKVVIGYLGDRRRRQFSDQLAETLQLLAGSLRSGHGFAQAMDTVAREAESPTAEEFRRVTIETRLGRDFTGALTAMAERMGSPDFHWVVQAVDIHREVGGDLAEIFDSLGNTIRDRTRIRRQVSALSAEGRMSAWVLMILPIALFGFMNVTNPDYVRPLYTTAGGYVLLGLGAVLMAAGGLWLRKIVKPVF